MTKFYRALSDKRFLRVIGNTTLIFAAVYVLLVSFVPLPPGNTTVAVTVVGSLLAVAIPIVLRYFFKNDKDNGTEAFR